MKVYSWNVNGLRAVHNKGALARFIKKEDPDVLLFQEIKVKEEQLPEALPDPNYTHFYHSAEKAGYSGTAIWVHSRNKKIMRDFSKGMPNWKDTEGRVAQCEFAGKKIVITVYVPNGGKSEEAYQEKLQFLTTLANYVKKLQKDGYRVIVGGDFNVARSEFDLAKPEKHRGHTHFNDEVRSHMEKLIVAGLMDTYRSRNPNQEGAYTYWDNFSFSLPRGTKPRDVNEGWRLDYLLVDPSTDKKITSAAIHQNIFGSDHCPISIVL
ncbi:MAG: exodeoxyribonuclease III [Candidatus Kaiserbacteria bacterium]|nr:exodeoxyribonuclease III [Candidatus Kaiserbacteria bacterium]